MPEIPAPTMMTSHWPCCTGLPSSTRWGVTVIVNLAYVCGLVVSLTTDRLVEPAACSASAPDGREPLPVVDELQRHVQVCLLQHRDDGLQIVTLLAGDADLVALDLRLDVLGPLIADELGDLLGVLAADALLEGAGDLVGLAGGLRLTGVERLQADVAADQLLLEDVDGGLDALLGRAGQLDRLLAFPGDLGLGGPHVKQHRQFLCRLV